VRLIRFCAGATFTTTDVVGEALLQYAWALAEYGKRDLIRIPVHLAAGGTDAVVLLIGPEAQLSSEPVPGEEEEIDALVAPWLDERTAQLRTPQMHGLPGFEEDELVLSR
jgi:hypothetical protein